MKDKDQKQKVLRYCVSKRWFPQLEVDVNPPMAVAKKAPSMTDLDVYASVPDDFAGYRKLVFDCKTRSNESPVNRSLWLRGVLDRMGADHGFCILKKDVMDTDHKLAVTRLSVILLTEDEFDTYAVATSNSYRDELGHTANMAAWDGLFSIKVKNPNLSDALKFVCSEYWMQVEVGETCRKIVGALREIRTELDPDKQEHVALAVEFAVLFSRTLAELVSFLFRAYLHPKKQNELEEAVRVILYGGRDAYEHRNQLYKMLKEKSGTEVGAVDLSLPEWPKFIQLLRQLLDAPIEASKVPLILREISFSRLLGSDNLQFCKTLCMESPQAGRFAVLIIGYLFKSAKLPPEFLEQIESALISQL